MNKREIRENIFKIIFQNEFKKNESSEEIADLYIENMDDEATDKEKAVIKEKALNIIFKSQELDAIINSFSPKWSVKRMGNVEKCVLRLAVYEMKFDEKIPEKVAINECIELAKSYGEEGSPSFVNGILGEISRKSE